MLGLGEADRYCRHVCAAIKRRLSRGDDGGENKEGSFVATLSHYFIDFLPLTHTTYGQGVVHLLCTVVLYTHSLTAWLILFDNFTLV